MDGIDYAITDIQREIEFVFMEETLEVGASDWAHSHYVDHVKCYWNLEQLVSGKLLSEFVHLK